MPLPAGIATVSVTGLLLDPDGVPAEGVVRFTPSVPVLYVGLVPEVVTLPAHIDVRLVAGVLSVVLAATDDLAGNPAGWTWGVEERITGGRTFSIAVHSSPTVQAYAGLVPVPTNDGTAIVVGPQGPEGPTGPTGPVSTVPGPTGPTGPVSTVPGPTGPVGPTSTVPGPAGPAMTDAAIAAVVAGPGPTATALTAAFAGKGGATKTDGQSVRNFRRPTLVVDKIFPNARHDHQVVWVDEALKIAYSVGQDSALRKSVWVQEGDEALIFSGATSAAAAGTAWALRGVFLRIPVSGVLLMESYTAGVVSLLRSTNDGVAWTTVWTSPGYGKWLLGPQSICRDENTGYLYLMEYTTDVTALTVDIWRSTDAGATWGVWKSFPRSEATTAGFLRHWHSARYDTVSQRVYFLSGDQQADAGIYRANAAGTDIEPVIRNSQITAKFRSPAPARCVDVMLFPTHIAWASDGEGTGLNGIAQNHVYRMNRDQIGAASPVVDVVAAIDNTGWYAAKTSDDGSVWLFSTANETPTPPTSDAGIVHLYVVTDNGSTVDEVSAVDMGGNATGFANISGLGGASGSGATFWLRAHNYQQFPNVTTSAFQFRARIGYGVSTWVKPNNQRQAEYLRQGRNWAGVLTAGSTFTFAHSRAPRRTSAISLLDFGARATAGSFGTCKFQIWNATTAALIYEYSGASWRADSMSDTADRWSSFHLNPLDVVEFRAVNTGAADITGSAFIEFGWAFF